MTMNLRGRYYGGGMVVTAERWWSRKDRKRAAVAARILEHERPKLRAAMREYVQAYMLYGEVFTRGNDD